jgi:predicted metal-dependent hydrolase
MITPQWAQDLIIDTILYLESKGYKAELPEIKYRHSKRNSTSATCYQHKYITITAGKDRRDTKMVILHELAHWVLPDNEHHGDNFWRLAFNLYKWQGLPLRVCINRESTYNTQHRSKTRILKILNK